MSHHLSGPKRQQQHQQRLAWLQAHPDLLARLPGIANDVEDDQAAALEEALRGMRHVRLYAPTASSDGARWGIRVCVSELRGQAVAHQYGESRADPRRI